MKSKRSMRQRYKARVDYVTIFNSGLKVLSGKKSLPFCLEHIKNAQDIILKHMFE